ncbi:hypothetical protein K450DRAFT_250416 [Umbelopsis ramanniana AG]|uniref:Amino-acid acetyltransferase, mitochondrial n=1 Tax=Umbelopsis ramanniana AG TaxID=1314678 RepID=A0AAD5E6K3_UMBRA|nr:uncharacterized protein K450DRAFT_250416 [Umbelopsis ramanniana AG]KAI8577692.1 hypothetical protein K450DRAFT_250416 [Umbelopsis ramanniana AG]
MFVRRCCGIQRRLGWRSIHLSQRNFSLQPLKKPSSASKQVTEEEFVDHSESPRDLILKVMSTVPSQRELRHFLKRYVPQDDSGNNTNLTINEDKQKLAQKRQRSTNAIVDALFEGDTERVALTKVQGPFAKRGWNAVASTLIKLKRLGLTSIIVLDSVEWRKTLSKGELRNRMFLESMALVESIERQGGRARAFHVGVFELSGQKMNAHVDMIQSSLDNNHLPVIIPIISAEDGAQNPITADEAMITLSEKLRAKKGYSGKNLTPAKIVVINHEGGIPNHESPGTAHSLINIEEEYSGILKAYEANPSWHETHPTAIENLAMIQSCLENLPSTSSAIITPVASLPSALITNLITDKPLYSSSLPVKSTPLTSRHLSINTSRTTVLRHGTSIHYHKSIDTLDLDKLTVLMEASFRKKLDRDAYYDRLGNVLDGAIIAGDYEGAVLVTNESSNDGSLQCSYLDKFAIAPQSQGIGLTDILWKKMYDAWPELMWRSRKDNGVNKWYFERSDGFLRLPNSNWVMFWYGANMYRQASELSSITRNITASFSSSPTD